MAARFPHPRAAAPYRPPPAGWAATLARMISPRDDPRPGRERPVNHNHFNSLNQAAARPALRNSPVQRPRVIRIAATLVAGASMFAPVPAAAQLFPGELRRRRRGSPTVPNQGWQATRPAVSLTAPACSDRPFTALRPSRAAA
jgi:hypothetical protein